MNRFASPLIESLLKQWKPLLISSLPGSVLRIWAFLHAEELAAWTPAAEGTSAFVRFALWSTDHALTTLLTFPLITVAGLIVYDFFRNDFGRLGTTPRTLGAPAEVPPSLDQLTAGARELLIAVSGGGEFRLEPRRGGLAVVVSGGEPADAREFCDDSDPEVAQRYRVALGDLERFGLVERDGAARRLTEIGRTAVRLVSRQELDRIAVCVRHLSDSEKRVLRLLAECQQRYNARRVVLRRDGTAVSAVYGNGQTVVVSGVRPLSDVLPEEAAPDAHARFEKLVGSIPADYLETLPAPPQRLRTAFVLRVTDTGLRYLRHAEVIQSAAA